MMIKYRVHQIAKDFKVPSKEIIGILKQYTGEDKKHMTALNENELSIIFEYYTQKNSIENFDEYFYAELQESNQEDKKMGTDKTSEKKGIGDVKEDSNNDEKKQIDKSVKKEEEQSDKAKVLERNADENKEKKPNLWNRVKNKFRSGKDNIRNRGGERHQVKVIKNLDNTDLKDSNTRVINTRVVDVDIEKYNEKYDNMAFDNNIKSDNVIKKQKFTKRSQYNGKLRRNKKETEAERLNRIASERKAKPLKVLIPDEITVGELASRLKVTAATLIKKLISMGTMASINDTIDFDTASLVAMEFYAKVEKEVTITIEERIIDDSVDKEEDLVPRAPVVVVMGHVDHGKTSLLDTIRKSDVISTEAGGITQHIGAYRVRINNRDITFLDTPGHEAFTTMRARGAQITDIAVLVVAADDGIMPQTIEAINHAKAAGVSIIVAINKIDKEGANPDRVLQQLTEHNIVPEEWGGDTPCVRISAKKKIGIEELLEMILLVSDIKELKANPNRRAKGTVIEARLDKGRGPIATILVQNGTIRTGDIIVVGTSYGKVRVMMNDRGEKVKEAGPSMPVEITGLDSTPNGGDIFNVVSDEKLAKELILDRKYKQKEEKFNSRAKITLDNLFEQMSMGEIKELKVIVKADVQGSAEAIKQSLEKLSNKEVRVRVIHDGVGGITESDVMLANASNAIIVGFNVRPDVIATENAKRDGVDIRLYRVIYNCIEEIESAMKGMLAPKFKEKVLGRAECRQVYKISNVGTIAGCYVLSGKVGRNSQIRVIRDGIVVAEDKITSLRRFKDDVKEVVEGYECGIGLERFNDIKEGDLFESFIMEEYREE